MRRHDSAATKRDSSRYVELMLQLSREGRTSRRTLSFLPVLIVGMALLGCGSSTESDNETTSKSDTRTAAPGTTQDAAQTEGDSGTKPDGQGPAREQGGSALLDDAWTGEDDGDVTEEDRAAVAIERFYRAISASDDKRMCRQLSRDVQAELVGDRTGISPFSACRQSFSTLLSRASKSGELNRITRAKIRAIELDGNTAVATVTLGPDNSIEIPLVNEGGSWKLAALRK